MVAVNRPYKPILGLALLVCIIGALVANALYGNLKRSKDADATGVIDEYSIKVVLIQEDLSQEAAAQGDSKSSVLFDKNLDRSYKQVEDSLTKKGAPPIDPTLLVSLRSLDKGAIPPAALATVKQKGGWVASAADALGGNAKVDFKPISAAKPTTVAERLLRVAALKKLGKPLPSGSLINESALGALFLLCGIAMLFFGAVGVAVLMTLIQGKKFTEGRLPAEGIDTRTAERYLFRVGIWLVLFVCAGTVLQFLLKGVSQPVETLIGGGVELILAYFAATVFLGTTYKPVEPDPASAYPREGVEVIQPNDLKAVFGRCSLKKGLLAAPVAVGTNWIVILALLPVLQLLSNFFPTPVHPLNIEIAHGIDPLGAVCLLIVATVVAPLAEELIFRGFLLNAFRSITGSVWWGLIIQAFLFAAIHPQGVAAWPALMAIGVVAGLTTYKTGSIWPGMIMHGIHNGLIFGIALALGSL